MQQYCACDVCKLLDGDTSIKLCTWCSMCQSWICEQCRPNMLRRTKAMLIKQMRNIPIND